MWCCSVCHLTVFCLTYSFKKTKERKREVLQLEGHKASASLLCKSEEDLKRQKEDKFEAVTFCKRVLELYLNFYLSVKSQMLFEDHTK